MSENNLASEEFWKNSEEVIPGSTRVPVEELYDAIENRENAVILDLGSGEGRSTLELKQAYPSAKIVAFDLNLLGLEKTTDKISGRVQGTVLELPFAKESVDGVVLCGVMTNITDKNPAIAIKARKKVIGEVSRVLKPGGICVLSDFNRDHPLSNYPVNYFRHQLITGEYGTIAVFDPAAHINFIGKSDDEVALLAKSPKLQRFAHHYSSNELVDLIESDGDLMVIKYSAEVGITPSGKPIDTIVVKFKKLTEQTDHS